MSKKIGLTAFLICVIDEEYEVTEAQFDKFFAEFNSICESDIIDQEDSLNDLYLWLQRNKIRSKITYTEKFGNDVAIENVQELKQDDADETI